MDKIIYTCSADYIGYVFPKRKWWDFSKKLREVQFTFVEKFSDEEIVVLVRILENVEGRLEGSGKKVLIVEEAETAWLSSGAQGCCIWLPSVYKDEIWQEFIKQSRKKKRYDTLLVVDSSGNSFPELLLKNAEDINYLAVFTEKPQAYEYVLGQLEREYGLSGMVFTQYRDFVQYQMQICEGRPMFVFIRTECLTKNEIGRRTFFRFPQGSLVLDFDSTCVCHKMYYGEGMENDYVRLGIFLDNIIKNRYNSVVNEGLQMSKRDLVHL